MTSGVLRQSLLEPNRRMADTVSSSQRRMPRYLDYNARLSALQSTCSREGSEGPPRPLGMHSAIIQALPWVSVQAHPHRWRTRAKTHGILTSCSGLAVFLRV